MTMMMLMLMLMLMQIRETALHTLCREDKFINMLRVEYVSHRKEVSGGLMPSCVHGRKCKEEINIRNSGKSP
jgi:hypothetical protein